ncbi:hypothetical protein Htur_0848 [Haloterrigena turkmenica DSM 5511]|uniref:Uncharacterized protein n=1 Tax=Haloterrigena turkmenica (strain ATCC 51198 / DSM 5511 / JCM 9101 / NCIMB 13204 / VKM B-1734 / 4k) TaxID=543526 RepID=D2RXQ9_HALTV|nr:hypothetical protein Htur_0848 [Haloterrigena turkmenica DSM 5511]
MGVIGTHPAHTIMSKPSYYPCIGDLRDEVDAGEPIYTARSDRYRK